MFLGGKPATAPYVGASQVFTFLYFLYFSFFVPLIPLIERLLIKEQEEELDYYSQNFNFLKTKRNNAR
jgi:hypothetical protein